MAVLGATGSIGTATIDVINQLGAPWRAFAISAHTQVADAFELARQTNAAFVAITGANDGKQASAGNVAPEAKVLEGPDALVELAQHPEVDTVVAAVVGSAGLESTLAAANAGKRIALANKEALVVAGELVAKAARESGSDVLPVDSEHSAIFQAIQGSMSSAVRRIVLTASGGPFRTWSQAKIKEASVEDALAHPTWDMGRKISIDSATMMNKALEVIEARWLFGLRADQIEVVVHPQSIVHSFVEFVDGSVIAQLSPPDMRLPIQYALTYPSRFACACPEMDWQAAFSLEFFAAEPDRFPALALGWEVVEKGGTCGAVVNAANEAAVELFLEKKIGFLQIAEGCKRVLNEHNFEPQPCLATLTKLDGWARTEIKKWAACC